MSEVQSWDGSRTNWLGTNSGRAIDVATPDPGSFCLEDIADGLANICRFNGQIKQWYSVAEHCIHVAEMVPAGYRGPALFHDAPEAFLCDVPTPLKAELGEAYKRIERVFALAIGEKFGFGGILADLPEVVKLADTSMAVTERDALQRRPQPWPEKYENAVRYPNFRRVYDNPARAKQAWLQMVREAGIVERG